MFRCTLQRPRRKELKSILIRYLSINRPRIILNSLNWNSEWLLIIPGGYLLDNPATGLNNFIDKVSDIRLFFQTYSYSGN